MAFNSHKYIIYAYIVLVLFIKKSVPFRYCMLAYYVDTWENTYWKREVLVLVSTNYGLVVCVKAFSLTLEHSARGISSDLCLMRICVFLYPVNLISKFLIIIFSNVQSLRLKNHFCLLNKEENLIGYKSLRMINFLACLVRQSWIKAPQVLREEVIHSKF